MTRPAPSTLFPTRRSSDLGAHELVGDLQQEVQGQDHGAGQPDPDRRCSALPLEGEAVARDQGSVRAELDADRKSTRLNSSHMSISYAVFCLKKKRANCQEC